AVPQPGARPALPAIAGQLAPFPGRPVVPSVQPLSVPVRPEHGPAPQTGVPAPPEICDRLLAGPPSGPVQHAGSRAPLLIVPAGSAPVRVDEEQSAFPAASFLW